MIATAALPKLGRGDQFKNGRQFSACLGLVPREHSSGGVQKLGGISKRGDDYLRRMLIQGAWAVIRYAEVAIEQRGRGSHWGQRSRYLNNRLDIRQQFDRPTQSLRGEQKGY